MSGVTGEDHLGFAKGGSGGGWGSGWQCGEKLDDGLWAKVGAGIGGGVKNEWELDGLRAEGAGEFKGDAWIGGSGVGQEGGFLDGARGVAVDDELHVGAGEWEEARAIGARGANFRVEGGGEKLAGGGAFHGEAGAIEENLVGGGCAAGKVKRAFETTGAADESSPEKDDNARMGDDEAEVVFLPRPAGHGGADKIQAEEKEPQIEPGGSVNVGAGDAGTKSGLEKSGRNTNSGQGDEQEHGEVDGAQGVDPPPQGGLASASEDLFIAGGRSRHGKRIGRSVGRTRGTNFSHRLLFQSTSLAQFGVAEGPR